MIVKRFWHWGVGFLLGLGLLLPAARVSAAAIDVCPSGCAYSSIQAAIDAAQPGDTLNIAAGTYTGSLSIQKTVILNGAGAGQTVIQAGAGYGIYIKADNVTLSGFTLQGGGTTTYGIKAEGSAGLTLQNLSVVGTGRSGIDFNGMNGVQLQGVSSTGAVGGVGIGITDSNNVQMSAVTTAGNAWGGIGIYTSGRYYPGGCSGISLTGGSSLGETNPLYVEVGNYTNPAAPYPATGLNLPGFDYVLTNPALPAFSWYQASLPGVQAFLAAGNSAFRTTAVLRPAGGGDALVLNGMSIQAAIDATGEGGTVRVYPGDYNETAKNRTLFNGSGPYQFGLFIGGNKNGLSVIGVDAGGQPILDASQAAARVTTNATNSFGYSGVFIESDHVTLAGLEILPNLPGNNKTIEVIGDGFTLRAARINVPSGSVYLNDWRYDPATATARVQSYTIENNRFEQAAGITIASGAGASGPAASRVIRGNRFAFAPSTAAAISFTGIVPTVGWFTFPVGGAIVENNTFLGGGQYIRARGTYHESQFNWASYWNNNNFDRAAIAGPGVDLPAQPRPFEYSVGTYIFPNVRLIGGSIQYAVDKAQAGDTVLVKAGEYPEQVVIGKDLALVGAGAGQTVLRSPAVLSTSAPAALLAVNNGAAVQARGLSVSGPLPAADCSPKITGVYVYQGAHLDLSQAAVLDIRPLDPGLFGCQIGLGIRVGEYGGATAGVAVVEEVSVQGYAKGGIVVSGTGSEGILRRVTVTGNGSEPRVAQNGIQISYGATGRVENSTVGAHRCDHTTCGPDLSQWQSAGILLYMQGSGVEVTGNTVENNDMGVFAYGLAPVTIRGNRILANRYEGVYLGQGSAAVVENDILGPGNYSLALVSDEGDAAPAQATLTHNRLEGAQTALLVTDLFDADAYRPSLSALENSFGASAAALVNTTAQTQALAHNWWGSKRGPATASNPRGDGAALNGPAAYDPWLCEGTDSLPAAPGFLPASTTGCTATATRLVFSAQPTGGLTDEPFAVQPVVRAEDFNGNLAVNFDGLVLISIGVNPSGGVLVGTPYVSAVDGLATFGGLYINKPGTGYTLLALSGSKDFAVSRPFDVAVRAANLGMALGASENPVATGKTLTYTAAVSNTGPQASTGLKLEIKLPSGAAYLGMTPGDWACTRNGAAVNCTLASLAPGASSAVQVQVTTPNEPGTLTAAASVSSAVFDPQAANNDAELDVLVVFIPPTGGFKMYLPSVTR